jgi:hypothetical protein
MKTLYCKKKILFIYITYDEEQKKRVMETNVVNSFIFIEN